jgi:transcriptional regulator with XRE-family HTH domain
MVAQTSEKKLSLRQLALELGVSHSYLSQVVNNKKKPSVKIAKALRKNGVSGNIDIGYKNGNQSGNQPQAQNGNQNGYHLSSKNTLNNPQNESKCARSSVDRASVFETGGRGFESLQAHHYLA